MSQKILFITSNNLSTNPRLVKELRLAQQNGYQSTVILFQLGNWSDRLDAELQSGFSTVNFIRLSATRNPFLPWLFSSVLEKLYRTLPRNLLSVSMLSISVGKRSFLLQEAIKKIPDDFHWVIAHNPAAFYPALQASQRTRARLGIDVEDYHPGEAKSDKMAESVRLLMKTVLTKANYCSYAAPLIMKEVHNDFPALKGQQITLLNGFESSEFLPPLQIEKTPLQLIWFSQNIDINRGLENLIPAVNELYPFVELHLVGNLKSRFDQQSLRNNTGIILHKPKPQKELHSFLSEFDIGVAPDIPVDRNRELALTNKIIAYAQAGLYILATKTKAHLNFLSTSELQFHFTGYTTENLRESLLHLVNLKKKIRHDRVNRFKAGKAYNWETNSQELIQVWEK
ncbi:MAG: hypothetical protein K2X48_05945 [Chitinophagaceae bacterium]|nr:hypothetical protein [Chitinophagaceae bacterium]